MTRDKTLDDTVSRCVVPPKRGTLQFLAQPKIGRKPRRGGKRGGRHVPRLKLFIPDTLVFNTDDEPLWYYTDKVGDQVTSFVTTKMLAWAGL